RVGDVCDNCPADRNVDQGDVDADGQGDVCDLDDGVVYVTVRHPTYLTWQEEFGLPTFNLYRGQIGVLKASGLYTQDSALAPLASQECEVVQSYEPFADTTLPPTGEALFLLATYNRTGLESTLGTDSSGHERPNTFPCAHPVCDRPLKTVRHNTNSGISFRQTLLIGDPVAWCQFWGAAFPCDTMGIDFGTEVALVAAGGGRANGRSGVGGPLVSPWG